MDGNNKSVDAHYDDDEMMMMFQLFSTDESADTANMLLQRICSLIYITE